MNASQLRRLLRRLCNHFASERGSATVEFLALALPLFIPLFLFLNSYALQSDLGGNLRTLSREMARGVVISESDIMARRVATEIFHKGGEALGLSKKIEDGSIQFSLICRNSPCISPNNEIQIVIASSELEKVVTSIEYVSPWA